MKPGALASANTPRRPVTSKATVDRDPASALLVDKKKPGRYLGGDNDGFGFTWVELFAKCRNAVPVLGYDDAHPQGVEID
jgi:hypothetical protein